MATVVPFAFLRSGASTAAAATAAAATAAESAAPAEGEAAGEEAAPAGEQAQPEEAAPAEEPAAEETAAPGEEPAAEETAAPGEQPGAGEAVAPGEEPGAGEVAAPAAQPAEEGAAAPVAPAAPSRPFGSVGQQGVGVPVGVVAPFGGQQSPDEAIATAPGEGPSGILLNFQDASITAVLDHLSEVAGLIIVYDASVQGRISILARQPVDVDEAVALLNTVLKEKGFAAVRMGRTLKVVTLADAKERPIPVFTGSDPNEIDPTDEMRTQVIPIRYADAVRLREDISALIPSYAAMTANASSNSLILTDTAANVRRIVEIVRALDTHMAEVAEVKVFPLKYADATAAARLINDVFQQQSQPTQGRSNSQARSTRFRGAAAFGRGGGDQQQSQQQQEGEGARNQRVFAAADQRTNTIVVSGPGDVLVVVEQVVRELDANPAAEQSVLVYAVKNGDATNLASVLNSLFSATGTQTGRGTTGRGTTGRGGTTTRGGFTTRFGQVSQSTLQTASGLAGQVEVVADEDSQSLLIMTAPTNFDQVRSILDDLDRAVPQVLIKVLIAEVSHDRKVDLGSEFSVLNLPDVVAKSALFSDFGVADASQGLILRLIGGDASALLRALETVGKLDILSRPYILASDNQEATITVGEEFPFVSESRTTETGQTINTIQREDIGIILTVTPHINPEGLVILDVSPEISAVTDSTVPISETLDAVIINKRSATTRVAIHDGQTIVIGGLMEDRKTDTIKKVPILGDIPLIGFFFRRTIQDKVKTELLIFLTPHVATEAGMLKPMTEDEMRGVQAVPGAVAPGTFQEHMRGMSLGRPDAKPEEKKQEEGGAGA